MAAFIAVAHALPLTSFAAEKPVQESVQATDSSRPGSRVREGLIAEYRFAEGKGDSVKDVSGIPPALDLKVKAASWLQDGGLSLGASTRFESESAAQKITSAIKDSNEVSIEAWIVPADTTQGGPARIVTLSADADNRNFTLGQDGSKYVARLRTTATGKNGTEPATATGDGRVKKKLSHVVYTRAKDGDATIFLNGKKVSSRNIPGQTTNWADDYRLALGNEFNAERTWRGQYHLVAVYDRALSTDEVRRNLDAGVSREASEIQALLDKLLDGRTINFTFGKDRLTAEGRGILDEVAAEIKERPNSLIQIQGHTDAHGSDELNTDLSKRRAASVKRYLVSQGIEEESLSTVGYGSTQPRTENPKDRENRRVEFVVLH